MPQEDLSVVESTNPATRPTRATIGNYCDMWRGLTAKQFTTRIMIADSVHLLLLVTVTGLSIAYWDERLARLTFYVVLRTLTLVLFVLISLMLYRFWEQMIWKTCIRIATAIASAMHSTQVSAPKKEWILPWPKVLFPVHQALPSTTPLPAFEKSKTRSVSPASDSL